MGAAGLFTGDSFLAIAGQESAPPDFRGYPAQKWAPGPGVGRTAYPRTGGFGDSRWVGSHPYGARQRYFVHDGRSRYDHNSYHTGKEVPRIMFWTAISWFVEAFANLGAGMASSGMAYEPEVPEELRK